MQTMNGDNEKNEIENKNFNYYLSNRHDMLSPLVKHCKRTY